MDVNLSVWDYYPKDDKPFIDPLYIPYQRTSIKTEDNLGGTQKCPVNIWSLREGMCEGAVNPALVRNGWGQTFQLMFPDKDPCPAGFIKKEGGWCIKEKLEFGDHGLYSEDSFTPKYQYFNGYASSKISKEMTELDPKSINPFTGNFVIYNKPYPSINTTKYLGLPSRDSLLG